MKYDFDTIYPRRNTQCYKYDALKPFLGSDDLIPMWVADMDFASAPEILSALQDRLNHPVFGYNFRLDHYYDSIIAWIQKRHQWTIQRNWIINTPGVVPALALAVSTFTKRGDKILIQQPVYHPFSEIVIHHERNLVVNQLIEKDLKYTMDFEALDKQLDGVKLAFLCSPHNPMGRVWTKEELYTFGMLCKKHGTIVIADEIHSDLVFHCFKHIPFATIEDFGQFTLTCYAPSKTFNVAGLATAAVITENQELYKKYNNMVFKRHQYYGNTFGITAFEAAFRHGEPWLDALMNYLKGSLDHIRQFIISDIPEISICEPESTFLLWLDMRRLGLSDEKLQELMLKKADRF
jgi:cysteine-S-conjugate beta-lyase